MFITPNMTGGRTEDSQTLKSWTVRLPPVYWSGIIFGTRESERSPEGTVYCTVHPTVLRNVVLNPLRGPSPETFDRGRKET